MAGPEALPRLDQTPQVCRPGDKSCNLPDMSRPDNKVPFLRISPLIDGSSHLPSIDLVDSGKNKTPEKDPQNTMSAERLSELRGAKLLDSWLAAPESPQKFDRKVVQPIDRHPEPKVETPKVETPKVETPKVETPKKPEKPDAGPVEFSEGDYDKAVEKAKELGRPLVMKFSATWCGPCKQMKPLWEGKDVKDLMHDKAVFLHVDADQAPDLMQKFGVRSVPTTMIARPDAATGDLKVQQRFSGGMGHDQLLNFLKKGLE